MPRRLPQKCVMRLRGQPSCSFRGLFEYCTEHRTTEGIIYMLTDPFSLRSNKHELLVLLVNLISRSSKNSVQYGCMERRMSSGLYVLAMSLRRRSHLRRRAGFQISLPPLLFRVS